MRGKVADRCGERQKMGEKLMPFNRRLKTLDEHIRHCENFAKHRKLAKKRDALYAEARKLD